MSRAIAVLFVLFGSLVAISANPGSREQVRLRAHFDSVLVELRARDVSGLSTAQLAARGQLAEWLSDYRDAGRFPLNDRYSTGPTPIFRDARGTLCAMAYLIERSGRVDIVNRIAEVRNLAYIRELADDTSLVTWLDRSGLTVGEAARIQPQYGGIDEKIDPRAAAATLVLSGASLAMAVSNTFRPGEGMGFVGMVIGTVTVMLGRAVSHDDRTFSAINVVSGGLAIVTGFYAAFRPRPTTPTKAELPLTRRVDWVPVADVDAQYGRKRFGLTVRF